MTTDSAWWQRAVIYQIYPKSFQASDNQPTGDLRGILQRLDYLHCLGVDALWLTPVYPSPQVDNGYDIADYLDIDPAYGSLADLDALIAALHARGMRLIMDIVVNHTSTAHPWFQAALADPASPYRDYYIWRPGRADGSPPTNWQSKFGGNAWALDEASGEYYLHLFAREQADLNWDNPAVRDEVKQILRFWAARGVDGFRLDVINLISKPAVFEDDHDGDGRRFYTDGPHCHDYLQELNREVFTPFGVMTVGEMSSTTLAHCQRYAHRDGRELSMVFNFHHLKVDYAGGEKWQLAPFDVVALKQLFTTWQQGMHHHGWSALFWCNHDQPRMLSRVGALPAYRPRAARLLAMTLMLLQGTPYIYQGEELGMTNPGFRHIDDYRDIESLNLYRLKQAEGMAEAEILALLAARSRDNSRTPMQWSAAPQAGFTHGTPWIAPANNYVEINAEQALADPQSLFYLYRDLIALRKRWSLLIDGDYQDLLPDHPALWAYHRQAAGERLLVLANLSNQVQAYDLAEFDGATAAWQPLVSNLDTTLPLQGVIPPWGCLAWQQRRE